VQVPGGNSPGSSKSWTRPVGSRAAPFGRYAVQASAKTLTSQAAAAMPVDVGYGSINVGQRDVDFGRVRSAE
jgi:hypothetical protein